MRAFDAFVRQPGFPCLGAKASQGRRRLRTLCAHNIVDARDDRRITDRLQAFAAEVGGQSLFVSLAVLFPCSARLSEEAFEMALWRRLEAIHAIDRVRFGWDTSVSDDPASARFSMSVGGKAFYVVGLHPAASRRARRFRCPVLVFNLHSQFERLRADGRYEKLRQAIIQRDIAYSGSANPMLAVHGKSSEARQYSGREVDTQWVCPFHGSDAGGRR
ncbi:guanitoxin biosynthesis heme-dependent pre-guanitoxin N-hydroxylase GntA [Rhodanobacter sp. Col0626]|uniref:guanitoxin biosynthesis heme-dependent pre-guanitoxin N-hydroxylase GntA n=1 Tax=Rhodanobacter sp. Col0626 TaxID=3415679 RepID=UPI003CEDA3DA